MSCIRYIAALLLVACALPATSFAQGPSQPTATAPAPASDESPTLSRLEQASQTTVAALGRLRIERWKTDAASKRSAQQNAESLLRNLNLALPGLIAQARNSPDSVAASFKLYRNLNALYDVMSSLVESAGAFGNNDDFQALGEQLRVFDDARVTLASRIEMRTAQQETEIARLRASLRAATAAPPQVVPAQPKKIVVDNAPDKSSATKKKKTAPKPAAGTPPGGN